MQLRALCCFNWFRAVQLSWNTYLLLHGKMSGALRNRNELVEAIVDRSVPICTAIAGTVIPILPITFGVVFIAAIPFAVMAHVGAWRVLAVCTVVVRMVLAVVGSVTALTPVGITII